MLNRNSDKPLFEQIKEEIMEEIKNLEPHSKIESEPNLAEKYKVSRGTVNKAINELSNEGRLYRIPKKGTYVSNRKIKRSFEKLPSYSEDIKNRGFKPGALLIELEKIVPSVKIKSILNLGTNGLVWKIKRIRTADEDPLLLSTSYLPVELVPEITREEVLGSLYQTLEKKYGNRPLWAHEVYTAVSANTVNASLLNIKEGSALIFSERISYNGKERPIEYAVSYIRGDVYEIHIDINHPEFNSQKELRTNNLEEDKNE
ncbi:GntR family transcriptional regulator [Halanaerobium sp. ST460_2HS_T2]|uniref:GntR family transcriptional regulator n=1 Tax=Halanaerobium sp. ST460_2HS_T2 TaxID=2183914 RepID=UPI000DF43CBF|nr:GntR family transcriptional regulator [Halanaerobium sp. ST460_2HS_T2]RCW49806.1 GntR family transcriptional regulator [Halanaerobium sp. ST460_2HS_T2]